MNITVIDRMKVESPSCIVLSDNSSMTEAEWRVERHRGLGGSDAGAILGLNHYKSAFMVYLDKLGLAPEMEETDAIKHGKRMEPVLRREFPLLFSERTGMTIGVFESPFFYQSIEHPFMIANIDGLVVLPEGGYTTPDGLHLEGMGGLEIKTAHWLMAKEWDDDSVPDSYYAQVQHYMAVLALKWFMLPVLIGNHFDYRIVPRNDEFIAKLIGAEGAFWNENVVAKAIPAPSGLEDEDSYLISLYGEQDDVAVVQAPELAADTDRYVQINDELKTLEDEKKRLQANFKARLGNAKVGVAGARKITWSRFERSAFNREKFDKAFPGVYDQFCEAKPSSRLTVS